MDLTSLRCHVAVTMCQKHHGLYFAYFEYFTLLVKNEKQTEANKQLTKRLVI